MKASDIPSECIEDPRFIKVLAASLCSEIAESKMILDEMNVEIGSLKDAVANGWERRKVLKRTISEMSKNEQVLMAALESLSRDGKDRSIEVEMAKNLLNDATLRELEDRAKFKNILNDYRETWKKYKEEYEELPLARERQECYKNTKRLNVQRMVVEYKKEELVKMINQREKIDAMRIRVSLVEISQIGLERYKDDKYLEHLKTTTREIEDQLTTYKRQLSEVQQEVKRKKLAESDDTTKMPPPRLDFRFMRSIIYPIANERTAVSRQRPGIHLDHSSIKSFRAESDTTSINSLMMKEMCDEDDYDNDDATITTTSVVKKSEVEEVREEILDNENNDSATIRQSGVKSVIEQSADTIQQKLQRLGIEKNVCLVETSASKQQSPMNNKFNRSNNNDEIDVRHNSPYQRNLRSFEEYVQKKSPSDIQIAISNKRSPIRESRLRSPIKESMNDEAIRIVDEFNGRELINSVDRNKLMTEFNAQINTKRRSDAEDNIRQGVVEQSKISSSPIPLSRQSNDKKPEVGLRNTRQRSFGCLTPILSSPTGERSAKKTTNVYSEMMSNDDEKVSEAPTSAKIRKIEDVDYRESNMTMVQERAEENSNRFRTRLSSPNRSYAPSCISSDSFSNFADENWPAKPRGVFSDEHRNITEFPSLSNWENWSPTRQPSEMSEISSIMDQGKNNDKPEIHREPALQNLPANQSNDNPPMNGFFNTTGFFKTTGQNSTMF